MFAFLLRRGKGSAWTLDSLQRVGTRLGGRWVVDGVDATPPTGALTGLLGPNGAGKTTLLRMIAGLISPEAGAVLVENENVDAIPRRARAQRIALLEQESTSSVPLTVREVVASAASRTAPSGGTTPTTRPSTARWSARAPSHLADRAWWSLSGGERQRVQIARALAQEPDLLLLDEPTNHLDVSAQLSLLAFVRDLGTTTVAALHDLNLAAAFCEHVLVLKDGHLAAAGHPRRGPDAPTCCARSTPSRRTCSSNPRTGRPVIAFHRPEPEQP